MLKIRLQRTGRRNNPSYRVVVVDSRKAAKKGKAVELLGHHDAIRKNTVLHKDRIHYWVDQGAQISDTMHNILVNNGIIDTPKKNVLPKKSPPVVQEKEKQEDAKKSEAVSTPENSDTIESKNTDTEAESTSEETEDQEDNKQHPSGES